MKQSIKDFPIKWIRSKFPAIKKADQEEPPFAFLDNAAGAQVPFQALNAQRRFQEDCYVLPGAHYSRSNQMNQLVENVRKEAALYLGASSPNNVVFGINATTSFRLLATSLAQTLKPGDEVIVSQQDHEANITPWLRLQKSGIEIKFWPTRGSEAILTEGDLIALLSERTKVVAVTAASNLLGSKNNIARISEIVRSQNAFLIVDGVHFSQHHLAQVETKGIDAYVCSGYKLFGPHVSLMYCSDRIQSSLPSLNHYFLDDHKLEIGAQNYEGVAALGGVFHYLDDLAIRLGLSVEDGYDQLYEAIAEYETMLSLKLLNGFNKLDNVTLYGISDPAKIDQRVATFSINVAGLTPEQLSRKICEANLSCRFGHMYAARLADYLKVNKTGGVVRVSLCHYNTEEEIDRLLDLLESL
jgi:cysteine desulfurase family protein (TIGR01976 family)